VYCIIVATDYVSMSVTMTTTGNSVNVNQSMTFVWGSSLLELMKFWDLWLQSGQNGERNTTIAITQQL